jgi:exosortase
LTEATPDAVPMPARDARGASILLALATSALACGIYGPILYYMFLHWGLVDDYSHGYLIGPLALYFAWERRRDLARAPIAPSWWGLVPLALGSLALVIGRLGVELTAMRVSFVLTLIGLQILLLGRRVFRILAFPMLFLCFMVPLPQSLVNLIAFPLQLIAADLAVDALHWIGVPALREGNIIHLVDTPLYVAEACSGLRSLVALGALAVVFAYFFRRNLVERALIVVSTLPIAILVNACRVALTGTLAHRYGSRAAEGLIHETEGFFTFGLAFGLLLVEAWLLSMFWPRRRGRAATSARKALR